MTLIGTLVSQSVQASKAKLIMYTDQKALNLIKVIKRDQHISLMIFTFYNHSQS